MTATELKTPRTPLPKKQTAILACIMFAEPVSLLILFPFIYFMVKDFHIVDNEKEIGYYVGYISSSFAFAQMISGPSWGWISDSWGRRPVLLIGLLGNGIATTLFGLSRTFSSALVTRTVCGLLNGNHCVASSMVGEITDETNEQVGFSIMGLMFGLGSIVGPMLGGFLTKPVEQFQFLFGQGGTFSDYPQLIQFLTDYPYFLPCFISSWVSFIGFAAGYFYLEETLHHNKEAAKLDSTQQQATSEQDSLLGNVPGYQPKKGTLLKRWKHFVNSSPLFCITTVQAVIAYSLIGLVQIMYDETFALWTVLKPSLGGLSFTSRDIGTSLTYCGFSMIFIQLIFYPLIQRRFGTVNCYRWAMFMYGVYFIILPNVSKIALWVESSKDSYMWVWISLIPLLTIRVFTATFAFTSSLLFVNTAGKQGGCLGAINGISQGAVSLVRFIGPTVAGSLWSWSLLNGSGFPFDFHFVFIVLVAISLFGFAQSYWIREDLTKGNRSSAAEESLLIAG